MSTKLIASTGVLGLLAEAHSECLRLISGAAGRHHGGLTHGAKHVRSRLDDRTLRRLKQLDIGYHVARHATHISCDALVADVVCQLHHTAALPTALLETAEAAPDSVSPVMLGLFDLVDDPTASGSDVVSGCSDGVRAFFMGDVQGDAGLQTDSSSVSTLMTSDPCDLLSYVSDSAYAKLLERVRACAHHHAELRESTAPDCIHSSEMVLVSAGELASCDCHENLRIELEVRAADVFSKLSLLQFAIEEFSLSGNPLEWVDSIVLGVSDSVTVNTPEFAMNHQGLPLRALQWCAQPGRITRSEAIDFDADQIFAAQGDRTDLASFMRYFPFPVGEAEMSFYAFVVGISERLLHDLLG